MMKFLQQIFSIKNKNNCKIIHFLGFKIKRKNNNLHTSILSLNKTNMEILDKLSNIITNKNNYSSIINNKFDTLLQTIQNNIFYENPFEEIWIKKFLNELEAINIIQAYTKLVQNLDEQSLKIIARILNGIKRINKGERINLLYKDEIKTVNDLKENYYPSIIKLSPVCHAYKKYLLPLDLFEVHIFYNNLWLDELKTLNKKNNKDFIDAGAFIGDSALKLSEFTNGKVHAFEPLNEHFDLMHQTIDLNNNKKIIPINLGLGKTDESQTAYILGPGTSCKFKNESLDQEIVKITSIDKYVKRNNLDIGLIKVDVEGFEQDLIKGAYSTIRNQKPILIISIYHSAEDFFYIKSMIEDLNLGYKFKIRKSTCGQILLKTFLIAEIY